MSRRPSIASIFILSLLVGLGGRAAAVAATSERYAFSTYRELSGRLSVFVDGYPASMSGDAAYVPVTVAIAMTKSGKSIAFAPESFVLFDASGHPYPAAGFQELLQGYDKLTYDRSLVASRPIAVGSYVTDLREVEARFYPPPNGGTRTTRVELAPFSWFNDILYFPRPAGGLGGVLTLKVAVEGGEAIDVRFEIPAGAKTKP